MQVYISSSRNDFLKQSGEGQIQNCRVALLVAWSCSNQFPRHLFVVLQFWGQKSPYEGVSRAGSSWRLQEKLCPLPLSASRDFLSSWPPPPRSESTSVSDLCLYHQFPSLTLTPPSYKDVITSGPPARSRVIHDLTPYAMSPCRVRLLTPRFGD